MVAEWLSRCWSCPPLGFMDVEVEDFTSEALFDGCMTNDRIFPIAHST